MAVRASMLDSGFGRSFLKAPGTMKESKGRLPRQADLDARCGGSPTAAISSSLPVVA